MVADDDRAYLVRQGRLLPWTPGGYEAPRPAPPTAALRVLTPRSIVAAIREGYASPPHPSVTRDCAPVTYRRLVACSNGYGARTSHAWTAKPAAPHQRARSSVGRRAGAASTSTAMPL